MIFFLIFFNTLTIVFNYLVLIKRQKVNDEIQTYSCCFTKKLVLYQKKIQPKI
jgi:hypothetical protein